MILGQGVTTCGPGIDSRGQQLTPQLPIARRIGAVVRLQRVTVRWQTDKHRSPGQTGSTEDSKDAPMALLRSMLEPNAALSRVLSVSAVVLLAGCASVPVYSDQMAVAESAVRRAGTDGTRESAPGELQLAIDKLESARQAVKSEDFARARRLAEQAEVDAQVAELRAQSVRSTKAARESQDAARVLREEIERKTVR